MAFTLSLVDCVYPLTAESAVPNAEAVLSIAPPTLSIPCPMELIAPAEPSESFLSALIPSANPLNLSFNWSIISNPWTTTISTPNAFTAVCMPSEESPKRLRTVTMDNNPLVKSPSTELTFPNTSP